MNDRPIRALIVDDEPKARRAIRILLSRDPEIEIVGEAGTVDEAVASIEEHDPDLLYLDVQMPGPSGFETLNRIDQERLPWTIFVTAYEEHAIRAFEVEAIDYLLKPVEPERLRATLERLDAPRPDVTTKPLEVDDWLFLPADGGRAFVQVADITHVTAAGDYTTVHTAGERYMVLKTMKEWEARLPAARFLRIHRGTIVDMKRVERVEPWSSYTWRVHLAGVDESLSMSRHYARRAERLLG